MPEAVYSLDKAPGYELHVHQVTQEDDQDLETIRNFLRNFRELLLSLGCNIDDFQGFEEELNSLPGKYDRAKNGSLWIGYIKHQKEEGKGQPAGCIAVREHNGSREGELKRMFVDEKFRRWGLGRRLAKHAINNSYKMGYRRLYLDSLERLPAAVSLYKELGFERCEPYIYNPMPDAVFMTSSLDEHMLGRGI